MTDETPAPRSPLRRWINDHELTIMYALIAALVLGGYVLIERKSSDAIARLCDASKANRAALVAQIEQVTNLGKSVTKGAPPSSELTAYLVNLDRYRTDSLAALPPLGKDCEA